MTARERVRIAVIGAGGISQHMHLPYLAELADRFAVVGVCDASAALAARAAAPFGIGGWADHRQMLDATAPDAVLVAVNGPPEELVADALHAGAHVLVEKPLAWTPAQAQRLEAAARRADRHLLVGYMKAYDPAVELAAEIVGAMGGVRGGLARCVAGPNARYHDDVVTIARADDVPDAAIAARALREHDRLVEALGADGAADAELVLAYKLLLGISCHELSVLRALLGGPPRAVGAAEIWDGGRWLTATLHYDDATIGYTLGRVATRTFDERFELYADREALEVSFPSPYLKHAPTLVTRRRDRDDGASSEDRLIAGYQEAFRRELEHFHAVVAEGATPRTPAAHGVEDARTLLAIVRAARDGEAQGLTALEEAA